MAIKTGKIKFGSPLKVTEGMAVIDRRGKIKVLDEWHEKFFSTHPDEKRYLKILTVDYEHDVTLTGEIIVRKQVPLDKNDYSEAMQRNLVESDKIIHFMFNTLSKEGIEYEVDEDHEQSYAKIINPQVTLNEKDTSHLKWIYDRLINVHHENVNFDYMIRFREIINKGDNT